MTSKHMATTITNYTDVIRTNVDQNPKGLQTTCLELGSEGIPTAYSEDTLIWHGKEYGSTQVDLSTLNDFWIEEIVDGVIYQHGFDGTNLTTYTDGVAGTPTAHTPESAAYLLGKGAYPKTASDPEAQNTVTYFNISTAAHGDYDQAARYTYLQGL